MNKFPVVIIVSLLVSVVIMIPMGPVYGQTAMLYVGPPKIIDTTKTAGTHFTVNINVKDITDFYGYQIKLRYNTTLLDLNTVTLGSFFPSDSVLWASDKNETAGYVRYGLTMPYGAQYGVDGSGTLLTIDFSVTSIGETVLDLDALEVFNHMMQEMPRDANDGYFSNIPRPRLCVDPEKIIDPYMIPGENFTVNVNIFNATDLLGFNFFLNYSTAVLSATNVTLGSSVPSGSVILNKEINDSAGFVWYNVTMPVGMDGDGILATISFTVDFRGESILGLSNTRLFDSGGRLIEHYTVDGYFRGYANPVYIRADGSVDPQTAPISNDDNVTYTFTDNINASIVVERNNIVVDGSGYTVQGTGAFLSKGIDLSGRNNVTVRNTTIRNVYFGIYFELASQVTLIGNNVTAVDAGIRLYYSSNSSVRENNIESNAVGVELLYSSNNSISGNSITANSTTMNDWYGIVLRGYVSSNSISGNNITANNITTYYRTTGILLDIYSKNNRVSGNNIATNDGGIELRLSSKNSISGNNIRVKNWVGIYLHSDSDNNSISGNNITNNDSGIGLVSSSNNSINRNNITANNNGGIGLLFSSKNSISGNNITNNDTGIRLTSVNNRIYHNNFRDNTQQVYIETSDDTEYSNNTWDNGYPSGGNYWSDYTGIDLYSGPDQNIPGSDFRGDTPYVINQYNIDRYPLTIPYEPEHPIITILSPEDKTYSVDTDIQLTFTIDELAAWMGYSLDDQTPVTIAGNMTLPALPLATHHVTLYANDTSNNMGMSTVYFTVLDMTNPVANAGSDRTVNEDVSTTLDGSASTDNVGITGYTWTFTDVTAKTLTGDKTTYTFSHPGVYTITLNVTDAAGKWAIDTVVITVLDVTEPVANAGQDQTVNVGDTVAFDAGESTDNVGIVSYEWDFGDGKSGTGKTTTHEFANAGTYTVTLRVEDAAGNQATDTVVVTVNAEEAFLWWIVAAAGIVAVGIAVAAVILRRRR